MQADQHTLDAPQRTILFLSTFNDELYEEPI